MEMSQIRYVLAAARTLNFTKAAEECDVSQPALTKGIKALEGELGASVFHREGRRILLSEFGRSMIPHLEQILEETEATRELARNFRLLDKAPIRLGVLATVGHVRLARFLAAFKRAHPLTELAVREATADKLEQMLAEDELDAVVMTVNDDLRERFRVHPLYSERYVVVLPPEHLFRSKNSITLADLSKQDYVDRLACELREMVSAVCDQNGVELYARFRSEREDWVQAMVLAGIGFAFMPEFSVSLPGLIQRPLIEPEVSRDVAMVTVPGRKFSPAVDAMMRSARSFAWPG